MDQLRIVVAIALSLLVFIVWDMYFNENKQNVGLDREMALTDEPVQRTETSEALEKDAGKTGVNKPDILETTIKTDRPDRIIEVQAPLYTVKISENRAVFKSFLLNEYRESVDPDAPKLEMVDQGVDEGTMGVNFQSALALDLNRTAFVCDVGQDSVRVYDKPLEMTFKHQDANGFVVEKRFTFYPDSYLIDMDVVVINHTNRKIRDQLVLTIVKEKGNEKMRYGFQGPSALIDDSLENIKIKNIEDKNLFKGTIDWIAYQDRYFISCILPEKTEDATLRLKIGDNQEKIYTELIQETGVISGQEQAKFQYSLYLGPKSIDILKTFGRKLDKAVNFGWFNFIAKPCLWLMNVFHDVIPNYGIAIIFLTLLTKIILWPLGSKSYKSMNEMKKIQPLMAEIREKYKDDKRKMNEEVMGLYRTYKINPLGGCLPMLVQIPVFFALYRMLYEAIELRHASFFGWINDLSAPDRLFSFDFSIPFMQPPYGIPVLTIVMGATMFLQQKMSPPMGDPAQAKMMMFMPIIFTFIFINFSSGLVLYWLVNNLLSIFQQYYIQKKYA